MAAQNWFAQAGAAYARYRPDYPPELAAFLAGLVPGRRLAVDVGCGNGQFTRLLAEHFETVLGFDASADQLAHAAPCPHVRYACAPAEALGLKDGAASLITAAQAAHWFDLPRFYREAERIAAKGAVLALITYSPPEFDSAVYPRFLQFYAEEIGPYWPPERKFVDQGYAGLAFPYPELAYPAMEIRRDWDWRGFTGYLSTWSAMRRVEQAGRMDIVDRFLAEFAPLWGPAETVRPVRFPIKLRLARLK